MVSFKYINKEVSTKEIYTYVDVYIEKLFIMFILVQAKTTFYTNFVLDLRLGISTKSKQFVNCVQFLEALRLLSLCILFFTILFIIFLTF